MAEEGAPVAEGDKPAAPAQGTDSTAAYDYRKIHSYPLIKVSEYGAYATTKPCILVLWIIAELDTLVILM